MMKNIKIFKKQLENGLTVLVVPLHYIPKVTMQLFYRVGSRHERGDQKGLAHFLEHMIFKGTSLLSESDINVITTKLSGSCNAFTSFDYTGYIFEFPTQHWSVGLQLFADCMCNGVFKTEHLNSELKAVIQELKMYRDNYEVSIVDELMGAVFRGHPYHYPIVGFKYDLCTVTPQTIRAFYEQHYIPNNATLVVVGDVEPDDVFEQANKYFGALVPGEIATTKPVYFERDFAAKSLTLYRDIQAPVVIMAFVVPGVIARRSYTIDILSWILGVGKGSRLYKLLVEQLALATDVSAFYYDLFEYGMFFIQVQPKTREVIDEIVRQTKLVLADLKEKGVYDAELDRAQAKELVDHVSLFEEQQKLSYALGKFYLATGDENYVLDYGNVSRKQLEIDIKKIVDEWILPDLMHTGYVLPLDEKDKPYWQCFLQKSDEFDHELLADHVRTSVVEEPVYANSVLVHEPVSFVFPRYSIMILSNGLEVLYYADKRIPKVEFLLEFKANYLYDPEHQQGLSNFSSRLLLKGTSKYTAIELADIFEARGIGVAAASGGVGMNCLSRDVPFALELLSHLLTDSIYDPESITKIRQKIEVDLAEYWDQPYQFVNDIVRQHIYGTHAYGKNMLGTRDSIAHITRDDLLEYYKKYITPHGTRIAVIGDFDVDILKQQLENTLGKWQGPKVAELVYPSLSRPSPYTIDYPISRDQIVLAFAGLSVARKDPDYDKLLLFDQEFGGGVLGAMSSMLFKIREQSGLFYTIAGSAIAGSDKQPGLFLVKTIVSCDRLTEAERVIKQAIQTAPGEFTAQSLEQSRRAIVNTLMDNFESYRRIGLTFLALRRFDLPIDYFDTRAQQLQHITLAQVQETVRCILDTNTLVTVRAGRI